MKHFLPEKIENILHGGEPRVVVVVQVVEHNIVKKKSLIDIE